MCGDRGMKSQLSEEIVLHGSRFLSSAGVVIPVWEPGSEPVGLVNSLAEAGCGAILVVEDGSQSSCRRILQQALDGEFSSLRFAAEGGDDGEVDGDDEDGEGEHSAVGVEALGDAGLDEDVP